jgi:hypothetical protein
VYLFQTDISRLVFNQRLIIALIGFGLLALGVLLSELRARVPGAIAGVRGFGVLACVLATAHLASSALPSFQIRDAVLDRARHRETSPYRYHSQASGDLPTQSVAWDALDFLTLPGPGWDVYLSAPWSVFTAAPAYGTRLQNRVWNFQARPGREPDALVFHFGLSPGWEQWYLGRPITAEQARSDPRYELVRHVPSTQLWVRRQRLAEPATRARLIEFYRRSYGADIETLRVIVPRLPAAGELVTSTPWGHALKYLGMTGALGATVHLVPAGSEGLAARQLGARAVLTVTAPLPGARGRELARMDTADGEVIFYINELES